MRKIIVAALLLQLSAVFLPARLVLNWSYQELFDKADLVVIAEPLSTHRTADVFDHEGNQRKDYTGLDTEFQARQVLKGEPKIEKFSMLHFRYADNVGGVEDGALFVRFRLTGRRFEGEVSDSDEHGAKPQAKVGWMVGKPDYLLFLKRRADGRYEPVTGQYDADLSCREVTPIQGLDGPLRHGDD